MSVSTAALPAEVLVGFHFDSAYSIRPDLLAYATEALGRLGIGVVVVPNSYVFGEDSPYANAHDVALDVDTMCLEILPGLRTVPIGPGGIQAVRAMTGAPEELEGLVPVVNGPALQRGIDGSKSGQAVRFPELMPATQLIAASDNLDEILKRVPGDLIVFKPNRGQGSSWVRFASTAEAATVWTYIREKSGPRDFVVQEYARGEPIPGLRALDPAEQPLLDVAEPGSNYELRVFCYASKDGETGDICLRPYGVYRVNAGQAGNMFVALEQDSLPPEAIDLAHNVMDNLMAATGVLSSLVAVDLFKWEGRDGLWLREYNTNPGLAPTASEHRSVLESKANLLAQLLSFAIHAGH